MTFHYVSFTWVWMAVKGEWRRQHTECFKQQLTAIYNRKAHIIRLHTSSSLSQKETVKLKKKINNIVLEILT